MNKGILSIAIALMAFSMIENSSLLAASESAAYGTLIPTNDSYALDEFENHETNEFGDGDYIYLYYTGDIQMLKKLHKKISIEIKRGGDYFSNISLYPDAYRSNDEVIEIPVVANPAKAKGEDLAIFPELLSQLGGNKLKFTFELVDRSISRKVMASAKVTVDLKEGASRYKELIPSLKESDANNQDLPERKYKNAALESEVGNLFASYLKEAYSRDIKVNGVYFMNDGWTVVKNEYGVTERRWIYSVILFEENGECVWNTLQITDRPTTDGGFTEKYKIHAQSYDDRKDQGINCDFAIPD